MPLKYDYEKLLTPAVSRGMLLRISLGWACGRYFYIPLRLGYKGRRYISLAFHAAEYNLLTDKAWV
jgi:hypothetical protein